MKTATFKEWDLDLLDKAFHLKQCLESEFELMPQWESLAQAIEISEFDRQVVFNLQQPLCWGGRAWNENAAWKIKAHFKMLKTLKQIIKTQLISK